MTFDIKETSNALVVDIPGCFAVDEAGALREDIMKLILQDKKDYILNFEKCQFIDSTGLGVLVAIYKKCVEKNGSVKIKALNSQVLKIFQMTRLDRVFEIIP